MINVLHDLLLNSIGIQPDKPAVIFQDKNLSYEAIYDLSVRLQYFLVKNGVKKGDRICFFLEKRFEKVISIFGISMAGGIFVPIRPSLRPVQVQHIINDAEASILIITFSRLIALEMVLHTLPSVKKIIVIDEGSVSNRNITIPMYSWSEIVQCADNTYADQGIIGKDLAAILYTSGSTGRAKGVVLNHHNIITGAKIVAEYLKLTPEDRILSILTFGFDYGLNQLTTAFYKGAQLILLNHLFSRDILVAIQKYQITGIAAVAATWIQLLQIPWKKESISSLRYVTNSGGNLPHKYVQELQNRLPESEIFLMYGLTEAFRSTFLDPGLLNQYPGSIGKAIPGEQVIILDPNNQPVKSGETGELVHRGELVAQGYWKNPEATAERFRKNPLQSKNLPIPEIVVYSGDYVEIDEKGYLYFVGRKDEMIKCAGNRISPYEVEEILYLNEAVKETVAFGFPDETFGQTIFAVVSVKSGQNITEQKIKEFCQTMMPSYMVPAKVEIWMELPRNSNGKLDRVEIKNQVFSRYSK